MTRSPNDILFQVFRSLNSFLGLAFFVAVVSRAFAQQSANPEELQRRLDVHAKLEFNRSDGACRQPSVGLHGIEGLHLFRLGFRGAANIQK